MVLNLVLIGVTVALDPLPLMAFLVILPSKQGVRKGAAFVFGWLASLVVVVAVTVLATGNNPPEPDTAPSLAGVAVKIAIGVILVAIAIRQRRRTGRPKKPKKPPKWQAHVDSMSVVRHGPRARSAAVGPDRRGRRHGHEAKLSSAQSYLTLFLFCILGSASYLAMEIYAGARPGKSQVLLAGFRTWIDAHTDQVIIWGSLILGFWLVANGINLIVS